MKYVYVGQTPNSPVKNETTEHIFLLPTEGDRVWNLSTAKLINYYLSPLGLPLQYRKTGWLKEPNFIFSQLQRLESKIKVPAGSVSGESAIRGLHTAIFSLCPHMVERESKLSGVSAYKGLTPHDLI